MRGFARGRTVWLTASALLAVQAGAVALRLPGQVFMSDVISFTVPLVAGFGCFLAVRRASDHSKAFWCLVGLGCIAWGLGDLGFSIYEITGYDPVSKLTLADAGYLALIPLWAAALITHPSRSRRSIDRVGSSIDAMVIMVIASTVTTVFVLRPALVTAANVPAAIVNTVYPVADLVLVAVLVTILVRAAGNVHIGDLLIFSAVASFAIGDIAYARLVTVDAYTVGSLVDLSWTAAFVIVAFAAGKRLSIADEDERRSAVPVLAIAGMAGIFVLAALAVVTRLTDTVLLSGAVATALLVVSRLSILLKDRARLVDELDEKVAELVEAHAARERFVATVSHDLRSPLASIIGFSEMLREPYILADPIQVEQMTTSIERNAERLVRLTEDLLVAGQFATGHAPKLKLEAVDLGATVQEVLDDMGRAELVDVVAERWVYAMADEQRVAQILVNLVENAFKHSGSSEVTVRIYSSTDGSCIEVEDKGCGIEAHRIREIFEPFSSDFRLASSVGLGLYVVGSLVTAMGGRISVTSELDHGASFKVVLPLAVADAEVAVVETSQAS